MFLSLIPSTFSLLTIKGLCCSVSRFFPSSTPANRSSSPKTATNPTRLFLSLECTRGPALKPRTERSQQPIQRHLETVTHWIRGTNPSGHKTQTRLSQHWAPTSLLWLSSVSEPPDWSWSQMSEVVQDHLLLCWEHTRHTDINHVPGASSTALKSSGSILTIQCSYDSTQRCHQLLRDLSQVEGGGFGQSFREHPF